MAESMEQTIEILLVDDHALFRQGVTRLLETEPAFKVVACESIKEALAVLRQRQIDIVLLDFDLGQRDGTRFVHLAKEQGFKGKILVVTAGVV
jgi:DNA-binding NarL/FixJ family response regulator